MPTTLHNWDENPYKAFTKFVTTEEFIKTGFLSDRRTQLPGRLSTATVKVYEYMFLNFSEWLKGTCKKPFSTLTSHDIEAFIDHSRAEIGSSARHRYLRLLSRCYKHLQLYPNPAEQAIRVIPENDDEDTSVLSSDEIARFIAALPEPTPVKNYRPDKKDTTWKRQRDRAMQIMMLCAGVKVSEAIGMLIREIHRQPEVDGTLRIEFASGGKHPTLHPHATHLRAEAVGEIIAWLDKRIDLVKTHAMQGDLLFPAGVSGLPLNKKTVYRQTYATFERAGIENVTKGGRTLRNTYAVHDLINGVDRDKLVAKLGLASEDSLATYDYVINPPTPRKPKQ